MHCHDNVECKDKQSVCGISDDVSLHTECIATGELPSKVRHDASGDGSC